MATEQRRSEAQNPVRLEALYEGLRNGLPVAHAARLAGIGARTVSTWRRSTEPRHAEIQERIETSISEYVAGSIEALTATRASDPKVAMYLLGHHPETRGEWGDRVETETDAAAATVLQLLGASMAARVQVSAAPTPPLLPAADD